MPKLSLIIATYNRATSLRRTLESLIAQTLPRNMWEVVVVDNNSTDNTQALFAEFVAHHPEINARIVIETAQGVSHARNRAIRESRGEYIVSVDDDEEMVAEFLTAYYDFFEGYPEAMAAGGKIVGKYESTPPGWLSPYTERPIVGNLDLGHKIKPFPKNKFFGGGNMGVRREAYERYGLFDTSLGRTGKTLLGGEEKDFYYRLRERGVPMFYVPHAIIYHIIPPEKLTDQYFSHLCLNIGRSERIRTKNISTGAYLKRLSMEAVKWGGTLVLSLWYLIRLSPSKSRYLVKMRRLITKGFLEQEKSGYQQ